MASRLVIISELETTGDFLKQLARGVLLVRNVVVENQDNPDRMFLLTNPLDVGSDEEEEGYENRHILSVFSMIRVPTEVTEGLVAELISLYQGKDLEPDRTTSGGFAGEYDVDIFREWLQLRLGTKIWAEYH